MTRLHFIGNQFAKVQIAQNDIANGFSFAFASLLCWSHFKNLLLRTKALSTLLAQNLIPLRIFCKEDPLWQHFTVECGNLLTSCGQERSLSVLCPWYRIGFLVVNQWENTYSWKFPEDCNGFWSPVSAGCHLAAEELLV